MDRRKLLTSAAVAAVTALSPARVHAENDSSGIEGSWFATMTITNPPVGQLNALFSFHPGGILTASARLLVKGTPFGDSLETPGHGAWIRTGRRRFEAFNRLFLQRVDTGDVVGTDNVRLALKLSRDGELLTGTFVIQGKNTSDVVLFEVAGEYSATRVTV